jgi:hypothetical protein
MFSQDRLYAELTRRLHDASPDGCPDLPPAADPVDFARLLAVVTDRDVAAVAVLRRFEWDTFTCSALAFALGLDIERRQAWSAAFTRTVFLAGNPVNLTARFHFEHVTADGSVAWFGPTSMEQRSRLCRLLKLFDATVEVRPPSRLTVDVPGAPGSGRLRRLYLATRGLSLIDYLVHLNHTLAEAVLAGVLGPGDRLVLHHAPGLGNPDGHHRILRVHLDNQDPTRLRAYACLTT